MSVLTSIYIDIKPQAAVAGRPVPPGGDGCGNGTNKADIRFTHLMNG